MSNKLDWWNRDGDGKNTLKGVEGDPNNPIILDKSFIIFGLQHSADARAAFDFIKPNMLPEEQARLNEILTDHPPETMRLIEDPQEISDTFQKTLNTVGIYTTGPRGGGRW